MKAMVFAAGLGSRLRPLTDTRPKALVEVAGKPMLQRVMERLRDAGFDEVVVNVHHFPDMIIDFLRDNGNFGVPQVHISDERDRLMDTGGGIAKAARWLGDEPVLVHNVDIVTDVDMRRLYESHITSGADASLLVSRRDTSRKLLWDGDMRMHGWINTATGAVRPDGVEATACSPMAFNGIHVINPSVVERLTTYRPGEAFSITDFYIDSCATSHIHGIEAPAGAMWHDIGKPHSLAAAEKALK